MRTQVTTHMFATWLFARIERVIYASSDLANPIRTTAMLIESEKYSANKNQTQEHWRGAKHGWYDAAAFHLVCWKRRPCFAGRFRMVYPPKKWKSRGRDGPDEPAAMRAVSCRLEGCQEELVPPRIKAAGRNSEIGTMRTRKRSAWFCSIDDYVEFMQSTWVMASFGSCRFTETNTPASLWWTGNVGGVQAGD